MYRVPSCEHKNTYTDLDSMGQEYQRCLDCDDWVPLECDHTNTYTEVDAIVEFQRCLDCGCEEIGGF